MLDARRYPADVRLLRGVLLFKLGFWAGMLASATLMKRMLPSRGDEESDEVALVAIRNGIELKSRSKAFRGGSLFSWFGGIAIDLREVELAENAHLDVHAAFGGIALRVPVGWRVESRVTSLAGGVAVDVPEPHTADAPTLRLDGFTMFGGVAVGAKSVS
jgi:Cell wall-active antibiotics response 4TMS YvqF